MGMKKVSQEILIKLLKNKDQYTYKNLAKLTGYHPKSLIRINSQLKKWNYVQERLNKNLKKEIINNYLSSNYQSYKDFYNYGHRYNISYSMLCKILENIKVDKEVVIIKKIKNKGQYYFEVVDYKTKNILFGFKSLRNDKKSFKKILYLIINNFGAPDNLCFMNFFKPVPLEIQNLTNKYHIKILPFKSIYRHTFNNLIQSNKSKNYRKVHIDYEDFYNSKIRKTIADNIIQFENIRYVIKSNIKIKKNEIVLLFYNDQRNDMLIKYKNINYKLELYKKVDSKKGNTKYS